MRLLKSDVLAVGLSTVVIAAFSALLYADFNKKIEVSNVKKIGSITFKREVAQRKYQSQVIWEEVDQNFPVYNNDSIRTSESSEAVIHLNDGTDINIDENSMIMLSTLANGININFEHGSISANRAAVRGTDIAAINIRSNDATVSIDKSNIQLTQLENEELDLTVSEGSARVKSSSLTETLVKSNEKAIISSDRKEARVVKLSFNLTGPANNRYILTEKKKTLIPFSWSLSGKSKDVTLQISRDRKFDNILVNSKKKKSNASRETLAPGMYYWRVGAVNSENKQIEYSQISKFNIVLGKSVRPVSPGINESIEMVSSSGLVTFKWTEDDMAGNYTLELSDNAEFTSIKKSITTKLRTISLDNIEPGRYYWRIKTNIILGGESFPRQSRSAVFSVKKTVLVKAPSILMELLLNVL